ncbi:restriction endonuclease subunit S [Microbacterium horticulturae]|uniref:Restriction endonuclease subunit S n=1 Tax=Microbacterium horticulturae TaxID=3028316 RepID=A0ABY8BYR3_9MICO|nr:restriction endonuclease subunit S [Microbacterium sp. KACC 23027]WEG09304.1 restriction endonuclease subunit S [Microbacterium sp. KACC 23027]
MSEWPEVRLSDVAEITVGFVGTMAKHYRSDGVPFLRSQNVLAHRLDMGDMRFISHDFDAQIGKSALAPGDVVTVRTGKPGLTCVVPAWLEHANCSDLVITRPSGRLDARWFSYYMNSQAVHSVNASIVGAVQQHFNVGAAKALRINLPPLPEQQAIAEVLGALDDKIAANTQLAASLEDYSRALVEQLFVAPVQLGDVVTLDKNQVNPQVLDVALVDEYSLPAYDAGRWPSRVAPSEIKSNKFVISGERVLLSKLNPRFPRIWVVDRNPTEDVPRLASTEFLVLNALACSPGFLWALLSQADFNRQLASQAAGTSSSHQRVRPADILAATIPDPRQVAPEMRDHIDSLRAAASALRRENRTLAATRDALLPQLMSGKLRVRDLASEGR